MVNPNSSYDLPRKISQFLATLSKLYAQEGERELQEIIVNSQARVEDEWTYDNWNGGTAGHAVYLSVPESLYLKHLGSKEELQSRFCEDFNKLHNLQHEHFATVFLEMDIQEDGDWRQESGLLLTPGIAPSKGLSERIWGDGFRVFLSHKSEVKRETSELKEALSLFGVSAFVAHEDIIPSKPWQDEIVAALASMDAFVALLTKDFHESEWTDQEIGFAFARGVPIVSVRLGRDPYGFIGKFQGLAATWKTAPAEIVKILIKQERMLHNYIAALRKCPSWADGNILGQVFDAIESLSEQQIDEMVAAYNDNHELRGSYAFNGTRPMSYGPGLIEYLNRFGRRKFAISDRSRRIEIVA